VTPKRLSQLIESHLEGRLTSSEAEELNCAIVGEPEVRRLFWEHTALHGLTQEAARLEWLGTVSPEVDRRIVRVPWWLWAVPLAAAAAVIFLAIALWMPTSKETDMTNGVAVLSRVVGVEWADAASPAVGAALAPGTLRLKSGALLVEFYSGARLVVEGPAELELISAMEVFLRAGKLGAQVPPPARGFKVGSPATRVVDLGTEFGMAVTDAGTAEVHVFSGKVEVHSAGNANSIQSLTSGEAVRLTAGVWSQAAADRETFLSEAELVRRGVAESEQRLAAWRVASLAWSGGELANERQRLPELSMRLHYRFEAASVAERVLNNSVAGAPAESHGSIVGCAWGEGRWPGKGALEFRGEGDRVRLTGPESMSQVSMLAWVRVDALPHAMHALASADTERVGALRWELTRTGQLRLRIGRDLGRSRLDWEAVNSETFVTPDRRGQWLLLATTFDGETMRHYGNGRPIGAGASFTPPALHLGTAELGNSLSRDVRQLVGVMDEFAVLSRVLSADELQKIYEQGQP
jgi:Concanavalin A-like lectin/glucanases superfamily/FecR protein